MRENVCPVTMVTAGCNPENDVALIRFCYHAKPARVVIKDNAAHYARRYYDNCCVNT